MDPIINEVATNHFLVSCHNLWPINHSQGPSQVGIPNLLGTSRNRWVFRTLCLLLSFEFLQLLPLTRQLQLLKGSFSFSLHPSPRYYLWFYLNKCHTTKNPSCKFVDKNRLIKCKRFIFDVIFQDFLNLYKLYGYFEETLGWLIMTPLQFRGLNLAALPRLLLAYQIWPLL